MADVPTAEPVSNLPWIEKYRPSSLAELISHEDIISTINRLIDARRLPHLLFYGPPGTGKTSTILACAKRLYGAESGRMVLELNASDDRGIDVVRDQIKSFAGTQKLFSKGVKLIILDEADSMTADAQFALRRVIEKYTKNTRFCLICNYVSKIIPALQSRCTRFRFGPLQKEQIKGRLGEIITAEKLNVTPDGLNAILRLSGGDMRRVLNILQSTAMAHPIVDESAVYLCTGDPLSTDIQAIASSLLTKTFTEAFTSIRGLCVEKGYALSDVLSQVCKYVTTLGLPPVVAAELMSKLSDIEYRLAFASSDKLQLAAMVGAFILARAELAKEVATAP